MKYFICTLDTVGLGIPAEGTERIISTGREQNNVYETENQTGFISLPVLFRQKDSAAQHGVVLKPDAGGPAKKTVLLVPRIDIDMEIPDKDIHSLPAVLNEMGGTAALFMFFSGAHFTEKGVIFILNTKKLAEAYCD